MKLPELPDPVQDIKDIITHTVDELIRLLTSIRVKFEVEKK